MSGVGYDSDGMPVYRLGQVIPQEKCGGPIEEKEDHDEVVYTDKYQPFAAVKENGETAVGLVGDVFMQNNDLVKSVLMVFGSEAKDVEMISIEKIFKLQCDLEYPEGFGRRKRFNVSAVCQKYWDAQESDDDGPAAK
jgi:hypothetical protein